MLITFSNTTLASPDVSQGLALLGLSVNGRQSVDEAQLFRAIAATFFPRGNKRTDVRIRVARKFHSLRSTEAFILTHLNELTGQAPLQITVGETGDTSILTLDDAVFEGLSIIDQRGTTLVVEYTFLGGLFTTEDVELPEEDDLIKRDKVALAVNDESKAVAYATPFGSVPKTVKCWVVPPSASASDKFIDAKPLYDTITAEGFTAAIAYPIPAEGYWLFYEAIL